MIELLSNCQRTKTYSPRTEGVGFEPTKRFRLLVFKTSAFNRSATPPSPDQEKLVPPWEKGVYPPTSARQGVSITTQAAGCYSLPA